MRSMGQLPYFEAGSRRNGVSAWTRPTSDAHHWVVPMDDKIEAGKSALQSGRWEDAVSAFESSLAEKETSEALDGMAEALWWLCEARSSVRYRERAFVKFRQDGDVANATRAAVNLSIHYLVNLGNEAASRGWLARAERVMGDTEANPMQGWLSLMRGFLASDPESARSYLASALDHARNSGDVDLELVALGDLGLALVVAGEPEEGIALLDEALAGTLAGEYGRLDTVVYTTCNMLAACHHLGDLERASQWCRVADEFMRDYSCPFLFARCRVHYGSVLLEKGQWTKAEDELQSALKMSEDAGPGPQAEALVRLADLRSRQGRLEEAEALLSDLNDAVVPLPVAELRLLRREPAAAAALLVRRVEQLGEDHIEAAPTLALLVDAHIAGDELDAAADAARRLDAVAEARGQKLAAALSLRASAHVAIAKGEPDAIDLLEKALEHFSRLNLPLETARVQSELAGALAERQPEVAAALAGSAMTAFEQLGAAADADGAASLLRSLARRPPHETRAHHVSNLLAKLGLRNRAEAVAYAARTQRQAAPK